MMARKYDVRRKGYKSYELPKGASVYERFMKNIISCAGCGKKLPFGDCYTSLTIHNELGIGYSVCKRCYKQEVDDYIEND